jgi:hypothetical protein
MEYGLREGHNFAILEYNYFYYWFGGAPNEEQAHRLILWKNYWGGTYRINFRKNFPIGTIKEQIEYCLKLLFPISIIPNFHSEYKYAVALEKTGKLPNDITSEDALKRAIQDVEYYHFADGTYDRQKLFEEFREVFIEK